MTINATNALDTEMTTTMTRTQANMSLLAMSVHTQKGEPMRLIDAIGLKQALAVSAILEDKKTIEQIIDEQPTIEERKTGTWVFVRGEEAGNALYMCSECGKGDIHAPEVKVSYCWNCGAEMRGAEDE